jgi:hypothetical protein
VDRFARSSTAPFPLEQAAEAHRWMENGQQTGKIILERNKAAFSPSGKISEATSATISSKSHCPTSVLLD